MGRGGLSPVAPPTARDTGSELGMGGPRRPPRALPAHRRPRGPGCLSLPLDTSPRPSLSHPARAPRADGPPGPGAPAAPHPHPTPPGAAGRTREPSPAAPSAAARGLTRSGSATGRRHAPRPQAAGEAGGRRRRASARRRRDPRLPPTPRWRSSRLLLRPAESGTFKNLCARNRPRPALAPPATLRPAPPGPGRPRAAVRTALRGADWPRGPTVGGVARRGGGARGGASATGAGPVRGGGACAGGAGPRDRACAGRDAGGRLARAAEGGGRGPAGWTRPGAAWPALGECQHGGRRGIGPGRSPAGSARGSGPGSVRERPAVRPSAGPARARSLLARPPRPRDAGFRARNWGGDVPKVTAPGRRAWSQGLPQASGSGRAPCGSALLPGRPPPAPAREQPPIHSLRRESRTSHVRPVPAAEHPEAALPAGLHVARSGVQRWSVSVGLRVPCTLPAGPPGTPGSWHSAPQTPSPSPFPSPFPPPVLSQLAALEPAVPSSGPLGSPSFLRTRRFRGPLILQRPARQAVPPPHGPVWFPHTPCLLLLG